MQIEQMAHRKYLRYAGKNNLPAGLCLPIWRCADIVFFGLGGRGGGFSLVVLHVLSASEEKQLNQTTTTKVQKIIKQVNDNDLRKSDCILQLEKLSNISFLC